MAVASINHNGLGGNGSFPGLTGVGSVAASKGSASPASVVAPTTSNSLLPEFWRPYSPTSIFKAQAANTNQPQTGPAPSVDWRQKMSQNRNYLTLSEEDKQRIDGLAAHFPNQTPQLQELLDSQRLTLKNPQSGSVLEQLVRYQEGDVPPGFDKRQGFADLTSVLAEPGKIKQADASACAQTTIEYIHARSYPADYARVMVDLLSKGKTQLASGDNMALNPTGIPDDHRGRTSTSRVYQASLSDMANGDVLGYDGRSGFHPKGQQKVVEIDNLSQLDAAGKPMHYGVDQEKMEFVEPSKLYPFRAVERIKIDGQERRVYADSLEFVKHGGLSENEALRALEAVTGQGMKVHRAGEVTGWGALDWMYSRNSKRKALEETLQKDLQRGVPLYVTLAWDATPQARDSFHALALEKIENGRVYLRNPWGDGDQGAGDRRVENSKTGQVSLPLEEFHQRYSSHIGPA